MTKKRVQGTDAESFVLPKGKRGITGKGSTNAAATSVSASKQVCNEVNIKHRRILSNTSVNIWNTTLIYRLSARKT